jgi:hypothetical protein
MGNPNTASFPSSLPDDTILTVGTNDAFTTLSVFIDNIQTTNIVVGLAFNVPCILSIDEELIYVGSKVGTTYADAVRGFQGTTPASHIVGSNVYGFIQAYHHNQFAAEIKAICIALGIDLANVIKNAATSGGDLSGTYPDPSVLQVGGVSAANVALLYSKIHTQGILNRIEVDTTPFDILASHIIIGILDLSGDVNLNLPDPTTVGIGKYYWIKDEAGVANTNNIYVTPYASEKIDGVAAPKVLTTDFESIIIYTNGVDWFIV